MFTKSKDDTVSLSNISDVPLTNVVDIWDIVSMEMDGSLYKDILRSQSYNFSPNPLTSHSQLLIIPTRHTTSPQHLLPPLHSPTS